MCLPVPLYHCLGCVSGVLSAASHGAASVLPGPTFSAAGAVAAVESECCTALYGTPTMFVDMLHVADVEQRDLSTLRTGCMAGAPCPPHVVRAVVRRLHVQVRRLSFFFFVLFLYAKTVSKAGVGTVFQVTSLISRSTRNRIDRRSSAIARK